MNRYVLIVLLGFQLSVSAQTSVKFVFYSDGIGLNSETDTIYAACECSKCYIIWQGDTIFNEFNHNQANGFISSLATFSCNNLFLISLDCGDGCPSMNKILYINKDGSYKFSRAFGNCNSIDEIKYEYPYLIFNYDECKELNRGKINVTYDIKYHKILEQAEKEPLYE